MAEGPFGTTPDLPNNLVPTHRINWRHAKVGSATLFPLTGLPDSTGTTAADISNERYRQLEAKGIYGEEFGWTFLRVADNPLEAWRRNLER